MASDGAKGGDTVQGLREQIMANAAIYFEKAVQNHLEKHKTSIIKPNEIFEIITIEDEYGMRRACLVCEGLGGRKVAAMGDPGTELEDTLKNLLYLLEQRLGQSSLLLFSSFTNCTNGSVDLTMS